MSKYDNYHKHHRMTMSYAEAEKYIAVGWKLESVNRVLLKGINKEIEQCSLVWEGESEPVIPSDEL